jgi:transposase
MDIIEISQIAVNKNKARKHFEQYIWPQNQYYCFRCGDTKIYQLANDRYRCAGCRLTFGLFTARWLGRMNLSASEWIWIIKLFELGVSARKIAREVQVSYPSALRAVSPVRQCIIAHSSDRDILLQGEVEADESYFGGKRGRGAAHKIPVFGILEREGIVKVEVLRDVTAESILGLTIKTVRRGSIVYTDKFRSYDALMFCG